MRSHFKSLFTPQNPGKYVGNISNIVARSKWEYDFFKFCDANPSVLKWGSEEIIVPYYSPVDNKVHRYFPDVFVELKTKSGEIKKMLVEIKPLVQTKPPRVPKRQTPHYINEVTTYIVNQAKWEAATEFCLKAGMEFRVITERELYGNK